MTKRTAPSSRTRPAPRRAAVDPSRRGRDGARVDVRGWLGGIRLSGFMMVMLGLVVLGAFVLVPTVSNYVAQRQQIAALQKAVQASKDEVAALQAQRDRWKDPAYITTQARERLYYVLPGEIVYYVVDDLPAADQPQEQVAVTDQVEQTRSDWMAQLVGSVVESGMAQTVAPATGPASTPGTAPSPSASPAG